MVWRVVCLAALQAIDYGRRRLWAMWSQAGRPADIVQRQPLVQIVVRASLCRFWELLYDFVGARVGLPGDGWASVGPDHPFLAVPLALPAVVGVRLPPDLDVHVLVDLAAWQVV